MKYANEKLALALTAPSIIGIVLWVAGLGYRNLFELFPVRQIWLFFLVFGFVTSSISFFAFWNKRKSLTVASCLWINGFWFLLAIVFALSMLAVDSMNKSLSESKEVRQYKTKEALKLVAVEITVYQHEHGNFSADVKTEELMKTLEDFRAWNMKVNKFEPWKVNSKGEIIDAWDTPIRIKLSDPRNPIACSAGPDKTWDTEDDLAANNNPDEH